VVNDDVVVVPVVVPVEDTGTNVVVRRFDVVTNVDAPVMKAPVEVVTGPQTHGGAIVVVSMVPVAVIVEDVAVVKGAEVVVVFVVVVVVVVVVVILFAKILMVVRPDVALTVHSLLSLHQFVSHRL